MLPGLHQQERRRQGPLGTPLSDMRMFKKSEHGTQHGLDFEHGHLHNSSESHCTDINEAPYNYEQNNVFSFCEWSNPELEYSQNTNFIQNDGDSVATNNAEISRQSNKSEQTLQNSNSNKIGENSINMANRNIQQNLEKTQKTSNSYSIPKKSILVKTY